MIADRDCRPATAHLAQLPQVRARLHNWLDGVEQTGSRFGDATAIVDQLRRASSGGKLLRPMLLLETHHTLGGTHDDAAVTVAAAYELLHTAFLVHDDVIDRDWVRRGHPNVAGHYRALGSAAGLSDEDARHHGASAAVIAGDLALNGASRLIATLPGDTALRTALLDLFDTAVIGSAIGELADIELPLHSAPERTVIEQMHRAKTGVYTFESPIRSGAVLAGADHDIVEQLGSIGRDLGVAYQLADDVAGLTHDDRITGKPGTSDLRAGKHTAVTVLARTFDTGGVLDAARTTAEAAEEARRQLAGAGVVEAAAVWASTLIDAARRTSESSDSRVRNLATLWIERAEQLWADPSPT